MLKCRLLVVPCELVQERLADPVLRVVSQVSSGVCRCALSGALGRVDCGVLDHLVAIEPGDLARQGLHSVEEVAGSGAIGALRCGAPGDVDGGVLRRLVALQGRYVARELLDAVQEPAALAVRVPRREVSCGVCGHSLRGPLRELDGGVVALLVLGALDVAGELLDVVDEAVEVQSYGGSAPGDV
jgi:hypothetical protein